MFCRHEYVYSQGHFYCTKCHHRSYKEEYGKRKRTKKAIGITGVVIVGILGFMFVSGIFNFNQGNLEESIMNIPTNIEESIMNIPTNIEESIMNIPTNIEESIKNIPEIPIDMSSIIPFKSTLIGKYKIVNQIEYTVPLLFKKSIQTSLDAPTARSCTPSPSRSPIPVMELPSSANSASAPCNPPEVSEIF